MKYTTSSLLALGALLSLEKFTIDMASTWSDAEKLTVKRKGEEFFDFTAVAQ